MLRVTKHTALLLFANPEKLQRWDWFMIKNLLKLWMKSYTDFPKYDLSYSRFPQKKWKKQNLNLTNVSATNFGKYLSHTLSYLFYVSYWNQRAKFLKGRRWARSWPAAQSKKSHNFTLIWRVQSKRGKVEIKLEFCLFKKSKPLISSNCKTIWLFTLNEVQVSFIKTTLILIHSYVEIKLFK